ncbi:hypothetical protein VIGAN_06002300 [Vigna angularis var. angularis]|uniref:MOSC domain-containing protein n=1 Tax=Vigna angularis var. angularis TaxID=157739 RepID=A0A0S3S8K4_PHAAN|nr:hypothetical protein VIGAN_06002300 [Vigna angularis var. angularis]
MCLLTVMMLIDVQKGISGKAMVQVSASRFRPNLVVSGGRPYAEDGWRYIRIGNKHFSVSSNNLLYGMIEQISYY